MMNCPQLKLIVLKTDDVESLRRFYAALGFQFVQEQHGNGPLHYSAVIGDGILEIYPLPAGTAADSSTRLGFSVQDIASVLKTLGESAVPKQTDWGLRAVVKDPDGRAVELYGDAPG